MRHGAFGRGALAGAALALLAALWAGPARAALVSYWPFDESASGTGTAFDAVSNNDGTFGGGAIRTAGLTGVGAAQFTNTNGDTVNVGNGGGDFAFSTGISVEARFTTQWNGSGFDEFFRKEDGSNRILLSFQPGNILSFGNNVGGSYHELDMVCDGGGGRPTVAELADGNPHHVVATYDAATGLKALHVDGTLRDSTSFAPGTLMTSGGGASAHIGSSNGTSEPFDGVLDEVAVYDASLRPEAVARHHAAAQDGQPYYALQPSSLTQSVYYSDTFTLGFQSRADGTYNTGSPAYDVERTYGYPAATWTPSSNFSFNDPDSSTNPALLRAAAGNGGADTGFAQSGGGDFSFAYGLATDYLVSVDAILPSDRLDISSLPFPGASIFAANSLSVFFRRDTANPIYPAIGLYNGSTETGVLPSGALGINDNDWHNFAVRFLQSGALVQMFVDGSLRATVDLTTFAGGIYQNFSNAAVGAGGNGGVFWVDNFQVGRPLPEPGTLVLLGGGLVALARRRRRGARRTLACVLLAGALLAGSAEAVTISSADQAGASWTGFASGVPDLSSTDHLDTCSLPFTAVPGSEVHGASAPLTAAGMAVLNDGVGSTTNNQTIILNTGATKFVRLVIDLEAGSGNSVLVNEVNSYGMITTDELRHYQRFALYASNATSAPAGTGDPVANDWTPIASVDQAFTPTDHRTNGVHIDDIDRPCRYLLFDAHTSNVHAADYRGNHYVELDVVGSVIPGAMSQPLSYWTFDEAASGTGTAYDQRDGNHGTFAGSATRTTGLVGLGAASFNNTGGDGVAVTNGVGNANPYSYTKGMTAEALIQPQWTGNWLDYDEVFRKEDGGNRILVSFQNDGFGGSAQIPVAGGPVLSFGLNTGGYGELDMPLNLDLSPLAGGNPNSGTIYLDPPGTPLGPDDVVLKDGYPHHVAVTYDQITGLKGIWVDGVLRWSYTVPGNPAIVSGGGAVAYIGNTAPLNEPFWGLIDEVAIYDLALSAGEIAIHAARGRAGQSYFVPEPGTLVLLGAASAALARRRRHQR